MSSNVRHNSKTFTILCDSESIVLKKYILKKIYIYIVEEFVQHPYFLYIYNTAAEQILPLFHTLNH